MFVLIFLEKMKDNTKQSSADPFQYLNIQCADWWFEGHHVVGWFHLLFLCWEEGSCVGIRLLVQSTPDLILRSASKSQQKKPVHSFNQHFCLSLSLSSSLVSYFHPTFDPPPFPNSPFKHPRCPQAAYWRPLHYAWRVCPTCGAWTREGKEVAHRFQ